MWFRVLRVISTVNILTVLLRSYPTVWCMPSCNPTVFNADYVAKVPFGYQVSGRVPTLSLLSSNNNIFRRPMLKRTSNPPSGKIQIAV